MTTDPDPDPSDTAPPRRHGRRRTFVAGFFIGLVAVVLLSGGALAAWDASFGGRILPGVHAGSVDLTGLDRDEAARVLAAAYPLDQGSLLLSTPDGVVSLPYSGFGRGLDVDAMVDAAMRAGRDGTVWQRATGEVRLALQGTTLEPRMRLDEAALAAQVSAVVEGLNRAPVDATISMGPDGPVTTAAAAGRSATAAPIAALALEAARRMDAAAGTPIVVATSPIAPAVGDDAVALAEGAARRLLQDVVLVYGKKSWTIAAASLGGWVRFETATDGSIRPAVDTSQVPPRLEHAARAVAREPVNASFLTGRNGKVVGSVAGRDGQALDERATIDRITAELDGRVAGHAPAPVPVAFVPVAPDLTTEEAGRTAPLLTRLGTWTTWFPISERNYFGANIWRPAQIINGTVLAPGHRFEWWSAVGPITAARGFGPGGVIKIDHTEPTGATGGGMCSSSTTLFNAALRAGLQINNRYNHRYYIDRYPLGLDATVSKMGRSVQTMSFTNDTAHAILIRGIRTRSGGRGFVTYQIWGVPDGRTVSIGRPIVTNVRQSTTRTVVVTTLPHGVQQQTEYPVNGMDVTVSRTVRNAAGAVIHQEAWRTHYTLWNGRIEVGA